MKKIKWLYLPIAIVLDISCVGLIKNAIMNKENDESVSETIKTLKELKGNK